MTSSWRCARARTAGAYGSSTSRRCSRSTITSRGKTMGLVRLADVDVRGRRVFIRADLNVPQDDAGAITDDSRIRASVPGIRDALTRGAAVMVTSHLGRPREGVFTSA